MIAYPREQPESLRQKEEKRKEKRKEKEEKKKEEIAREQEQIKRLKNLTKEKILERIGKIQDVAGSKIKGKFLEIF